MPPHLFFPDIPVTAILIAFYKRKTLVPPSPHKNSNRFSNLYVHRYLFTRSRHYIPVPFLTATTYNLFLFAAKNLALAGVKSVTLHDVKNVDTWDLSSNFFLSEQDIGKNRAVACVSKLQDLNNAVLVSPLTEELTKDRLSRFQVCH